LIKPAPPIEFFNDLFISFVIVGTNGCQRTIFGQSCFSCLTNTYLLTVKSPSDKTKIVKQPYSPDLHIWGSADLLQTLIRHNLVDTFWLMIYPVTLGSGKRLFADGTMPRTFKVTESQVTPSGVIVVNYERVGEVATGSY
jgi:dihydrofolate reductase